MRPSYEYLLACEGFDHKERAIARRMMKLYPKRTLVRRAKLFHFHPNTDLSVWQRIDLVIEIINRRLYTAEANEPFHTTTSP